MDATIVQAEASNPAPTPASTAELPEAVSVPVLWELLVLRDVEADSVERAVLPVVLPPHATNATTIESALTRPSMRHDGIGPLEVSAASVQILRIIGTAWDR